jgi:hypothetical protein
MTRRPDKVKRSGRRLTVWLPATLRQQLDRLATYRHEGIGAVVRRWVGQGLRAELPESIRARISSDRARNSSGVNSPSGKPCGNVSDSAK